MKNFQDQSPSLSLTVLGTLCFVTLVLCQIRFKISKEISIDIHPPVLRTKDSWFLYSVGNPDRFKCVLKAFVVVTSPIISLISTGLLLLGKIESNPYFFIPWLFFTFKGLLLIQVDNLVTIIKDMGGKKNLFFGFRLEGLKWFTFYSSILMIDLVEVFSFCEILDIFLVLWNHHPGYNLIPINIEAMKKDIAEIMDTISTCSFGHLSKMSLGSESDNTSEGNLKKDLSFEKFSECLKEKIKLFIDNEYRECLSKGDVVDKKIPDFDLRNVMEGASLKSFYEGDKSNSTDINHSVPAANLNVNEMDVQKQEKRPESRIRKPNFRVSPERVSLETNKL